VPVGLPSAPMWRSIRIERVLFPPDSDNFTLAVGTDTNTREELRLVVPPDQAPSVLADLHAGFQPTIKVHEFDVVDWSPWWEETGPV
jgi:hypothetical protein